ncbi:hypothetical protein [Halorubrum tebenquichense]|uniref:Uncharacterized protein n=1 Tax=Halorubrum tebenquichense DSM 14210 TaxID=1227485 RepID=M0E684_9EURY|nr:hypothetical protein [Halorubrum tebenquichense]ELZ41864.1 hypothetical protein C472_00434 [Halorubrum tebenquichense DSM 14210]
MADTEDEFGQELGGDPAESGGSNDGYDGGGSGGSGGGGFFSNPLSPYTDILTAFAQNPRGFVIGAVATTILETVTGVVTTVVEQLVLLVGGSQPARFNAPNETIGLADLPVAIADLLIGAGGFSGEAIIGGIETFNATIADAAAAVGPFGPLVLIVLIVVEVIVAIVVLRRIVYVAADLLQLGGLTE